MTPKEQEFRDIFLAEASEQFEELNQLFTQLEKKHTDSKVIDAIFRIMHTLKANAAALGFSKIAEFSHLLEDIFSTIKQGKIVLNDKIFNDLFRANDTIGAFLEEVKTGETDKVKYKGLKTKLEVLLRNSQKQPAVTDSELTANVVLPEPTSEVSQEQEIEETEINQPQQANNNITFSERIQVPIKKLDGLFDLVGELMIESDRLALLYNQEGNRKNEFNRLKRITSELQYAVMNVRMVQIEVLFQKFHRIVRDVAMIENKKVNLILEGTENEIDRTILQTVSDSLVHIVRNAVSHGIESPQERLAAHKPEIGTVKLSARSEKDYIIIEVTDDGKGIDAAIIRKKAIEKKLITPEAAQRLSASDVIDFIFEPGFSVKEEVTAVSGRGVGMDVVRKSIQAIGGNIEINTMVGQGSRFTLLLPASMVVKGALLFEQNEETFAIPLSYTDSVVSMQKDDIHLVGKGLIATHLGRSMSVIFLKDIFDKKHLNEIKQEKVLQQTFKSWNAEDKLLIVIVSYGGKLVGLVIDKLLQQKEIVERPLKKPLDDTPFMSGATIMGNGKVCLVLDVPALVNFLFKSLVSSN